MPKIDFFLLLIYMKRFNFYKPGIRYGQIAALSAVLLAFVSCAGVFSDDSKENAKESIKVMNWNLQTFFDANFDGNEYAEYKSPKSGWSQQRYEARLDKLASVIKETDADVIIMEELEKEEQIQDIANRLSGTFDFKKLYSQAIFATNEGASIGCAVLSRLPIEEVTVHALDIREGSKQPSMRPIIRLSILSKDRELTIFVNHWKSKSGGAEESEIWRKRQEKLLADLIWAAKKDGAVLAVGDFNKEISEFDINLSATEGKNVILHGSEDVEVYSPWINDSGEIQKTGSYWYKNHWERIDHFFVCGNIELTDFCAETEGEWADSEGRPLRYQIWSGRGYSDHLPITCTVKF